MFSRKEFSSGSFLFKQETYKNGLSKFIKQILPHQSIVILHSFKLTLRREQSRSEMLRQNGLRHNFISRITSKFPFFSFIVRVSCQILNICKNRISVCSGLSFGNLISVIKFSIIYPFHFLTEIIIIIINSIVGKTFTR